MTRSALGLPAWAASLFRFGGQLYDQSTRDTLHPTLALCLPRIEYAALFLSLGWLLSKASAYALAEGRGSVDRLRQMLHHCVSFDSAGKLEMGRLVEVPEDENGYVKILVHKGRKTPDLTSMSLEKRIAYKPPISCGTWICSQESTGIRSSPSAKTSIWKGGCRSDSLPI